MPRLRYIPTTDDQARVRELAAIGMSDDDIASLLRLPLPRLQKAFRLELKEGAAAGREQALKQLHDVAISGQNLSVLQFWVKARCGWRDTGSTQAVAGIIRHTLSFKLKPAFESKPDLSPSHDEH